MRPPPRMIDRERRALVYMSKDAAITLKRLAKRAGVSQAWMFRRGIDLVIAETARKVKP